MSKKQTIPEQIQQLIKDSGKSKYQIAKDSFITASTLQRVKEQGWGTQFETASKILDSLGYKMVIVKK